MTSPDHVTQLHDPTLGAFDTLMSGEIPVPLAAAFEHHGSTIEVARRVHVTWRPGRQLIVRYRVDAVGGSLDGTRQVVASAGGVPDGAFTVEGPDGDVAVWILPRDPALPGLASALDTETVQALLPTLGIDDPITAVRLRAYRPMRRAVVEVRTGSRAVYLKVVPGVDITRLHGIHRHLARHLPVPDSLGFAPDLGIMVLGAVPGSTLRELLLAGRGDLPDPAGVAAFLDALPDPESERPRGSTIERVPGIVELLIRLDPDLAPRLSDLTAAIGPETDDDVAPVHGDFHEAQIMVAGGHITGLLDVDTYGWGRAADDAATMLAHLTALIPRSADAGRSRAFALGLQRRWDARHDPADLRRRTAAALLGLATGPFRVQSPDWPEETRERIAIAESWAASAREVAAGS